MFLARFERPRPAIKCEKETKRTFQCPPNIIHAIRVRNNKTWYNTSMVIEKVSKTAEERSLFEKGGHIVMGISGGPDSVCLLHVLYTLAQKWKLTLHGVHVNHGIRGREADLDQAYTEDLCKKLGIPCTVFHYDVPSLAKEEGLSEEETGRILRYRSFCQVRDGILQESRDGQSQKNEEAQGLPRVRIAVAQNRNDQAETILLRILRGTGPEGLSGMEYIREDVIIRPLLDVSREEIEEYCREKGLSPRIDRTNLMPVYARNKVRLELLPLLAGYNPNIVDALCRLGRIASEDRDYFNGQVEAALRMTEREGPEQPAAAKDRYLDRESFRSFHPAISKRLIAKVLKEMGLLQDIAAIHLEEGDRLIRRGKSGDRTDFPKGYYLALTGDTARFGHRPEGQKGIAGRRQESDPAGQQQRLLVSGGPREEGFSYPVNLDSLTEVPELNAALRTRIIKANSPEAQPLYQKTFPQDPFHVYLEYEEDIFRNLRLRTRCSGDHMVPLGMKGTKKIQDLFVDEKIPLEQRDRIPLVCFGQEVLWVVGRRVNESYKVKKNGRDIVSLEYIRF